MKHPDTTLINVFTDLQVWLDEAPGRSVRLLMKETHAADGPYPAYTFIISPEKDYHTVDMDYHYEIQAGEVVGNVTVKFTNLFSGDSISLDMNSMAKCEKLPYNGGVLLANLSKNKNSVEIGSSTTGAAVYIELQEGENKPARVFDSWHTLNSFK